MTILINESKFQEIIKILVLEAHSQKELSAFMKYAMRHLNSTVEFTKNGYRFCPPRDLNRDCYSTHKHDNAMPELYKFYGKTFSVSRLEVERAFKDNRPLNLDSPGD